MNYSMLFMKFMHIEIFNSCSSILLKVEFKLYIRYYLKIINDKISIVKLHIKFLLCCFMVPTENYKFFQDYFNVTLV